MHALRALLEHSIDYAGMFPPAQLDLDTTVGNYVSYRTGPDSWALGHLILAADQVRPFVQKWPRYAVAWPIAIVLRTDFDLADLFHLLQVKTRPLLSIECTGIPEARLFELSQQIPPGCDLFIEIDLSRDLDHQVGLFADMGAMAKLRTGGVTANAIPPAQTIAHFMLCCTQHRVRFKATAGLHHALRGPYPLTYEPDSQHARMHGFLNVLLAAALANDGATASELSDALEETSLRNLIVTDDHICWRDRNISVQQIVRMRQTVMAGFGSCSFTEPLHELRGAGLLA